MRLIVCGYNYDRVSFWQRLLLCLLYPFLGILVGALVLGLLVLVALLVYPCLAIVWVAMIIKLFKFK